MIPDNADPANVMDQALQDRINLMNQQGVTQTDAWNRQSNYKPAGGWDIGAFQSYLQDNRAVNPPFNGAPQLSGGWQDQATQLISGGEGFSGNLYHDPKEPLYNRADNGYKPGQYTGAPSQNATIGYGFNISAHGTEQSRQIFNQVLGIPGDQFDQILQGNSQLTQAQGQQLRDYTIQTFNNKLQQQVKVPLQDYQRAALLSMMYNFGEGGFHATGIPDAINQGASPIQIANMIRNAGSAKDKSIAGLNTRRAIEAMTYLGQNQRQQEANNAPGQPASPAQGNGGYAQGMTLQPDPNSEATGQMSEGFVDPTARS